MFTCKRNFALDFAEKYRVVFELLEQVPYVLPAVLPGCYLC